MTAQSYPAARNAAPRIHVLFTEHAVDARRRGRTRVATVPDANAIEAMIGAAFWASLRREEGYSPKISLAFLSPDEALYPLLLERPLALDAARLTRLAPAVERAGIHLGVSYSADQLSVWGTTSSIPVTCFVVEVAAPGLLVVKQHRGEESGKFLNIAVLEGDRIKIVDWEMASPLDRQSLLSSLGGSDTMAAWGDAVNIAVQLAVSMRAHGRGGLLLIVQPGSDGWRESIVQPIMYAVSPPFMELAELNRGPVRGRGRREWRESLARVVEAVAGLTAVDGATIMTSDYQLLAFGAKIARKKGSPQIDQVALTEPIEGAVQVLVDPTELGGTRHLSAAQFVHDQPAALALVASQDGRFTVFARSADGGPALVHAHRVEALLL